MSTKRQPGRATGWRGVGAGGQSQLAFTYSKRGVMTSIGGSYGTLLAGVSYTSDGLVDAVTLGDAAATQRSFEYDVKRRIHYVQTVRSAAPQWSSPPPGYTPPVGNQTAQLELEHYGFEYDDIDTGAPENGPGNIWKIRDYRSDADWPASARPVTREFRFDDLYRVTQAKYTPANGVPSDPWTSPYAAEVADPTRVPQPSPHVSFVNRVKQQDFIYDWLGNIQRTTDNESGFWDRSIGNTTRGTATNDPNQMRSATNRVIASTSPRKGDLSLASDVTGNYTDLVVRRDGPCLPGTASCWQRFKYEWNEVGELVKAKRWDLTVPERTANDATTEPVPPRPPNAELRYTYEGSERTLKTAVDAAGLERHTVYIFGGLELRSTEWNTTASPLDFDLDPEKVQLRLPAGIATARVLYSEESLPTLTSGKQHVFLELKDQIGSGTFIIDKETGELVEAATYQAYGAPDSDYRPSRWESYREPNKFSGKEDDIELGLVYFGARYYAANLGTWMSPDPVTIHEGGSTANPYEYVGGSPLMNVDPDGRELISLGVAIGVILVSTAIAGGTSIAIQAANNGWGNIDWGWKGVAGAALTGAVAGGVTLGMGSWLGGATGALSSLGAGGSALASGALAGTAGAAAAYVTSSLTASQKMTWSGLGKAVAIGGVGGLVGGAAGFGAAELTKNGIAATVSGAGAGSGGSVAMSAAFGEKVTPLSVSLSLGGGIAGAVAGYGLRATSASATPNQLRNPTDWEVHDAMEIMEQQLAAGDRMGAARTAADLWGVPKGAEIEIRPLMDDAGNPIAGSVDHQVGPFGEVELDPVAFQRGAGYLASTMLHESIHLGQWYSGNSARTGLDGHAINEMEGWAGEFNNADRLGQQGEVGPRIMHNFKGYLDSASGSGLPIRPGYQLPRGAETRPWPR